MMARGFVHIINIKSSAVKSPVDGLGLSTVARSGLTGFMAGLARITVARGVTINNLLPGTFDTQRLASNFAAEAKREGGDPEAIRARTASPNTPLAAWAAPTSLAPPARFCAARTRGASIRRMC